MNIHSKTRWLALGALLISTAALADPRETKPGDQSCAKGDVPAVLVHVTGLKNGSGTVRVQAYGPGSAKYLKKGEWAGRVDVPLGGRRSVDVCLPLPGAGQYSVAVRHDSNANRKSDWNDGAGFSRNPELSLLGGRPSFGDTAIAVQRGPAKIRVVVNYRRGMKVAPIG